MEPLESPLHCRGIGAEPLTLLEWSIYWGGECLVNVADSITS